VGEGNCQVVDDLIDDRVVCDEGNNLHLGSAGRTGQRINLINLPYPATPLASTSAFAAANTLAAK
jgi:hypothetical protein